jgi:hypothetical protein
VSTSIGPKGARINLSRRGVRGTTSIPGSGLSYSQQLAGPASGRRVHTGIWLAGLGTLALFWGLSPGTHDRQTAPTETPAPGVAAIMTTMYVTASTLNCRSAATSEASVLAKLGRGETVSVGEEAGEWTRIRYRDTTCWAASRYLSLGRPTSTRASLLSAVSSQPSVRQSSLSSDSCPCSRSRICIGPRGGRYCITSGGNKRYGV